jgi:hypothetical protein
VGKYGQFNDSIYIIEGGSYLNAVGGNDVAEAVVIVTQELWEIVQQNQKHTQCSFVEKCDGLVQLCISQEWRQEFEQVDQQLSIHSPALNRLTEKNWSVEKAFKIIDKLYASK